MEWIITALSITGVILNTLKNKWCFAIWLVTNFAWMMINFYHKMYAQSFLFFVYFILAIWGLYNWSRKKGG